MNKVTAHLQRAYELASTNLEETQKRNREAEARIIELEKSLHSMVRNDMMEEAHEELRSAQNELNKAQRTESYLKKFMGIMGIFPD